MRTCTALALALVGVLLVCGASAFGQQEQPAPARKVLNRVTPNYPDLARTMNVSGVVRLEADVAPNGVVKTVSIKGGHPLLAQAAETAVRKWKWEPATHESSELIEVHFDSH